MTLPDRRPAMARLAFRILLSSIFLGAGLKHLLAPEKIAGRLAVAAHASWALALGSPTVLVSLSGLALALGGMALALGLFTRWAALGLALVLIPITLTVQLGNPEGYGPLLKNVALLGALIELAVTGAGLWSFDQLLSTRARRRAAAVAALLALGFLRPPAALASARPTPEEKPQRVLVLVQKPPQLKVVLETEEALLAGHGLRASAAEIVVCGPAAKSLVAGDALEPLLLQAHAKGVRIVACGLTLRQLKLDPKRLSPAVEVVPNGLVEAFQRQAEGWLSVEL